MTFRRFSKRAVVTFLFIGALVAGSIAYAWWTASGSGNGYAQAKSAQLLTTSATAVTTADLYPGHTDKLYIQINNPNPYAVTVTDITANGQVQASGGSPANNTACTNSNSVTLVAKSGLSISVPANGSTTTTVANAVTMDGPTAVDACQGLTFTVPVSLAGTSA